MMISGRLSVALLLFVVLGACTQQAADERAGADLILINARVYTLAWGDPAPDGALQDDAPLDGRGWHPDAEAVVIGNGGIEYVGTTRAAMAYRGEASRVVDLAGATVVPGLVDSHTHVFELGTVLDRVNLVNIATEEEAVAAVAARARNVPRGEWIVGWGWDEGAWGDHYPDKTLLSQAVPDHPVFLDSLHGFAAWANQRALDAAGIDAATEVPVGGEIRLGDDGEPNGLLFNRATVLLDAAIPAPSREVTTRRLLRGLQRMAEDGYVAIHEAGVDTLQMSILEQLEQEDRLPIRVYAMLSLRDEPLIRRWLERGPDRDADSMLVTRSVKAYYDGALGSRGARLLYDYADRPGYRGLSGSDYGFDEALAAAAMRAGFQLAIHAIGDAGNREALDFLEREFAADSAAAANRHRIEHAQVIHPDDLPRFGQLGIIASMEPPHAMEDKAWAEARLGAARLQGAYAWRSLRETGAVLTFNADNPASDHSIFYGLHSAITRQDRSGQPEGGWYPEQAVNADEALRAYTRWSAYASFREDETGVIAAGRWADLTVMDVDPFLLADERPDDILQGRILMTIVGGKIVYERD